MSRDALYRDVVVQRARHPLHAGAIDDADGTGTGTNPLCGDRVEVSLRRDADGLVSDLGHRVEGCAICIAAADLMADRVVGLDAPGTRALWERFDRLLQEGADSLAGADRDALGLLNAFADLHQYRSRRKCAALPWSALLAALDGTSPAREGS